MMMAASDSANVGTNPLLALGTRVERMRRVRGMTQNELADALRVTHHTLSAIENGREPPGRVTQERLVEVLGPTVMTPEILSALRDIESPGTHSFIAFGARLRECRLKAKYTPEFVAEMIGVTVKAIHRWEDGRNLPTTEPIAKLEALFGVEFTPPTVWKDYTKDLPKDPPNEFGPRMRYFRMFYGFSTAVFASWIGSKPSSVNHWEQGKGLPKRDAYDLIVDVLGDEFVTPEIARLYAGKISATGKIGKGRGLPPLPPTVPTEPGPRIKYYRIAAGMTLDKFAEALEVSRATAYHLETGRTPTPEQRERLIDVLGPKCFVQNAAAATKPRSRTPS